MKKQESIDKFYSLTSHRSSILNFNFLIPQYSKRTQTVAISESLPKSDFITTFERPKEE
tara:strand:- start:496 stop:672 length:177 start_codon:yes stop_codon:yes gene_type:complete